MGINFPSSPTVGDKYPTPPVIGVPTYSWDGEKWVTAISPSSGGAPFDAMAYSGMQINGGMEVSQELSGAITLATGTTKYLADGWVGFFVSGSGGLKGQQAIYGTPSPLSIPTAMSLTATAAFTSVAAGDRVNLWQPIEGYRWSRLNYGGANAKSVTIGFWVHSVVTGTASVALRNGALNRCYVSNFTINAASTWEYKTVTIPGDVTGTWNAANLIGAYLMFTFCCGSTYQAASNTWVAGDFHGTSSNTNFFGTINNAVTITGVTVLPGSQAPTAAQSPLIMRPYDQELVTCKRYYQVVRFNADYFAAGGYATASAAPQVSYMLGTELRAAPTMTIIGTWTTSNCSQPTALVPGQRMYSLTTIVTTTGFYAFNNGISGSGFSLDARL